MMEAAYRRRLGNYLRGVRETQGLTQENLAGRAGYHPTYIAKLESGDRLPSLDTILDLAKALRIPAAEIVAILEDPERVSPATESMLQEINATLRGSSLVQLQFVRDFLRLMEFHSR